MIKQGIFKRKSFQQNKGIDKQNELLITHHIRKYKSILTEQKDIEIKAQQTLQQVSDLYSQMQTIKVKNNIPLEDVSPWEQLPIQKNTTINIQICPQYKRRAIISTKYNRSQPLKLKQTNQPKKYQKISKYLSEKKQVFCYQQKNPQLNLLEKSMTYMKLQTQQTQFNKFKQLSKNIRNLHLQSIKNQILSHIQQECIPFSIKHKNQSHSKVKHILHRVHSKTKTNYTKTNNSINNPISHQLYNRFIRAISKSNHKF